MGKSTDYPEIILPHVGIEVSGGRFFPREELVIEFDSAMMRTNGARLFGCATC